jgi:hypothetical protein
MKEYIFHLTKNLKDSIFNINNEIIHFRLKKFLSKLDRIIIYFKQYLCLMFIHR